MILDMEKFGLKPGVEVAQCQDASPFFERANAEGCQLVQLGSGAYRFDPPVFPNFGVLGLSKSHTGPYKNFPSDQDTDGILNYRDNFGLRLAYFSLASMRTSHRNGRRTGCLISMVPPKDVAGSLGILRARKFSGHAPTPGGLHRRSGGRTRTRTDAVTRRSASRN
jgi:hypothetical protein